MSESVVLEYELNSPIEKVWHAITDSATMSKWMMFPINTFRPEVGHAFQLSGAPGYDVSIECEVQEIDEPHKLVYSWQAPGVDGQLSNTVVTFTLAENASGGTSLQLEQSGFRAEARQELGGAKYGWQHMLGQLESVLS